MRTHRVFPALQPWLWRADLLRELAVADRLVAARIEPVTRGREPAAFLDLHFSDGARAITIPLIYIDLAQLDVRELDPLVFPQEIFGIVTDTHARGMLERVFPDLEQRAMSGGFWQEEAIHYGDATLFETARARGFFGAAPLAVSLPRIAPAVYARRFALNKHVVAYGSQGPEYAGFLTAGATSCTLLGEDGAASAWYGAFPAAAAADGSYDLAIGNGPAPVQAAVTVRSDADAPGTRIAVVTPLPADVMLSFDASDGSAPGSFAVDVAREPFVRTIPDVDVALVAGGSAGRVTLVVRPDAAEAPDADTAEAAALAQALRREGFTVEIVAGVDALDASVPDLVHLFGVFPGAYARSIAQWAGDHRKPFVVHAFYESPANGGYWGAMVAPYCFGYSADDRSVSAYLEMLARRAVEVDGITAMTPHAPAAAGLADAERVLSQADVVLVNSQRELAVLSALRARRPTFIVPPLPVVTGAEQPIGPLVGTDPFILVHAPIWPEANQLVLARAAADVGAPIVFAGAVADPLYAERLREFASDQMRLLAEPGPETLATLYRAATVAADAAWTTRGHGRLATAAAFGAAVVCSNLRWIDFPEDDYWRVDPADVRSIARGLGNAWDASLRSDARIQATARFARQRLGTACAAIVATYAKIVQAI